MAENFRQSNLRTGMKKIIILLLLISINRQTILAQSVLSPMIGKAFSDQNGASAIRMGLGCQSIFKERWGVYYTYEYRSNFMFFENSTYGNNEYKRDLCGISCKIHPNFMMYGGVGMFIDGIFQGQLKNKGGGIPWIIKPQGVRKELGLIYQPKDSPLQISMGYSFNVGFTGNLGWSIPLKRSTLTVHQAITEY